MRKAELLDIVEAAYDVERDEQTWLAGIVNATRLSQGRGLAVFGLLYRLSAAFDVHVLAFEGVNMAERFDGEVVQQVFTYFNAAARRSLFGRVAGTTSEFGGDVFALIQQSESTRQAGICDYVTVNAMDPTRMGCSLNISLPPIQRLARADRSIWNRVAAHVSAAYRLRRKLGRESLTSGSDAILSPSGRVEHAEEPAKSREAREELRRAVLAVDRSRTALRHLPDQALRDWQGLVGARWTLIDYLDSDGKRFVIARQNDPAVVGFASLSERELKAVAYASLGHTNKLIAYELGLSASTAGVLLWRAAKKLGTNSRSELIRRFVEFRNRPAAIK